MGRAKHRKRRFSFVLLLLGCASEATPTQPLSEEVAAQELCQALCGALPRCELELHSDCEVACLSNNAAFLARSDPYATRVNAQCIAQQPCTDGLEALLGECNAEVRAKAPPTEASVAFCDALAAPFFECLYFVSPDGCAWTLAGFSEAALTSGLACRDAPCDTLASCLDTRLWNYGNVPTPDVGGPDAGFSDAGFSDAGFSDAGFSDAGFSDAGFSDAGAKLQTDANGDAEVGPG